ENHKKEKTHNMSSSSQYHLVFCFFLLSFSSLINSQEYFVVIVTNETKDTVNTSCSVDGKPKINTPMESEVSYQMSPPFNPKGNNTVSCEMTLREKHGVFMLFDSNDKKTCHTADGDCEWSIREDGLCLLVEEKCVMFKWDTTHYNSFRKITNKPIKYVARNTMQYMPNNP
ncbi:hypothetical protein AABB24_036428, partial [Solanum stoloniferum]